MQCRKALEAICHDKKCHAKYLGDKLKVLCEQEFIDSKILSWAGEIKSLGDRGAHEYREAVSREEAYFALEFSNEVARYIYVLTEKYERFKRRDEKKEQSPDEHEPHDDWSPGEPEVPEPPEE
jgi:hypothetical protein